MKNQAKTQHSVFKFIRAAIPVTVLSAIQYAVISTLLVVGKIDLQWSELATSLPLCIIAIFSTAFVFYDPNEYEYFLSVLGMLTVWVLVFIASILLLVIARGFSFITSNYVTYAELASYSIQIGMMIVFTSRGIVLINRPYRYSISRLILSLNINAQNLPPRHTRLPMQ